MIRKIILIFIVLFFIAGASCRKPAEKEKVTPDSLSNLMPDMLAESQWKSPMDVKCYTGDELFNYMNGGAELYHDYGFKAVCVQDYQKNDNLYTTEVYEMENSQKAFGIYSINREGEHPPLGQEGTYQEGSLNIWKDHFYIHIFTPQKGNKEEMILLGEKITSKIKGEGEMPNLFKLLPKGKIKDTAVSFWRATPLNNIFFISHENFLNLEGDAEGLTFLLPVEKDNVRVILIKYTDTDNANNSLEKFVRGYFSLTADYKAKSEYKGKKGEKLIIAKTQGQFLLLVFGNSKTGINTAVTESLRLIEVK
ncbi:MAG: DUF6599 family protein [Nitrospinota bacterium]